MRRTHFVTAALAASFVGCTATIPEGKLRCNADADCPSKWVCVEQLCYRSAPNGGIDGGGGGDGGQSNGGTSGTTNGGTNASTNGGNGGNNGTMSMADAGFDAGIVTSGCDVLTPFYRDGDGDGLGNQSEAVNACSVATGYVTNGDDCNDSCMVCTKPDAKEMCDGFDNNCNGKVDEGALAVGDVTRFAGLDNTDWAELVTTQDGGVLFTVVTGSGTVLGQRISMDGEAVGDPVKIEAAAVSAPILAADHLNGKIVLMYPESDGIKAVLLKASDLSVLAPEKTVGTAASSRYTVSMDVAVSTSASGGRALFIYDGGGAFKVQSFELATFGLDTGEQTVYTLVAKPDAFYTFVTLVGAPCLSGYYAAVADLNTNKVTVIPLGDQGKPSGTKYEATIMMPQLVTAVPALRVEGGDCKSAPTKLLLGYATGDKLIEYSDGNLFLETLQISRAAGQDTLTRTSSATFKQMGWVLPGGRAYPSGAFYLNRAIDIMAYRGRTLFAAMAADAMANKGSLYVYEIEGSDVIGTQEAPTAPVLPANIQLNNIGGKPYIGASSWTSKDAAGVMRIGCGN